MLFRSKAHGEPLGADEIRGAKAFYHWDATEPFFVPPQVYETWRQPLRQRGAELEARWNDGPGAHLCRDRADDEGRCVHGHRSGRQRKDSVTVPRRVHRADGASQPVVSHLRHPNTIQVFDYGQTPDGRMIMEGRGIPGFQELPGEVTSVARRVVPALIGFLGDGDTAVRVAAARALGWIGPEAAEAIPALDDLSNGCSMQASFSLKNLYKLMH